MLTIRQIIQNYSDDESIVIKISDKLQGLQVLSVLYKWGFHWAGSDDKTWQPASFPYCLRIVYDNKTLRYGFEEDYQTPPFYVADASKFLQECTLTEG